MSGRSIVILASFPTPPQNRVLDALFRGGNWRRTVCRNDCAVLNALRAPLGAVWLVCHGEPPPTRSCVHDRRAFVITITKGQGALLQEINQVLTMQGGYTRGSREKGPQYTAGTVPPGKLAYTGVSGQPSVGSNGETRNGSGYSGKQKRIARHACCSSRIVVGQYVGY